MCKIALKQYPEALQISRQRHSINLVSQIDPSNKMFKEYSQLLEIRIQQLQEQESSSSESESSVTSSEDEQD